MGAWGTGIRQDDFVCDVEDAFEDCLRDGRSVTDASELIVEQYSDTLLYDPDEAPLLWIALADMQWKYGNLDPSILERVTHDFHSNIGMERWGDTSEKLYKQRKEVLAKFIDKISRPNPRPTRPPKRVTRKPKFAPGDCLSIKLDNGQYGAAIVLVADHSDPAYGKNLVGVLDYLSDDPPTGDVFSQRNWLKRTRSGWQGELDIVWYSHVGFRKMKHRLKVINNIPVLDMDPKDSLFYAGWNLLGQWVLLQSERDAERNE